MEVSRQSNLVQAISVRVLASVITEMTVRIRPPEGFLLGLHDTWQANHFGQVKETTRLLIAHERGIHVGIELRPHDTFRRMAGDLDGSTIRGKWFGFTVLNGTVSLHARFSVTPIPQPIRAPAKYIGKLVRDGIISHKTAREQMDLTATEGE